MAGRAGRRGIDKRGQCPNGHTLCQSCKAKMNNICLICRQELGNIRCLALEKVAESLELPCKYKFLGCDGIFIYHSRLRHEQSCRYRRYNCPYAGAECPVTGDIMFLIKHLKDDHNVDMHDGSTFNNRHYKLTLTMCAAKELTANPFRPVMLVLMERSAKVAFHVATDEVLLSSQSVVPPESVSVSIVESCNVIQMNHEVIVTSGTQSTESLSTKGFSANMAVMTAIGSLGCLLASGGLLPWNK